MNNEHCRPWWLLRAVEGIGDALLRTLVETFGSPEAVLAASEQELLAKGCHSRLAGAIRCGPSAEVDRRIDRDLKTLDRLRASVITWSDARYPVRLRAIPDPPPMLYCTGTLEGRDQHAIAIVGARRATVAGRVVTEELSHELAQAGFTIVSGLARGIDASAHRGALTARGRTLAVLGCGIDRTYPSEHAPLRHQVETHGAVLSELPVGSAPHSYHFPRRNRIISGLALGVIVTEAAAESGSLITAKLAADQGREVFAVPGFVKTETSRGTNALIKQGARLVERAQDVIDELLPQVDEPFKAVLSGNALRSETGLCLGMEEALVYDVLSYEPQSVEMLIERTRLGAAELAATLLALELKKQVRRLAGNAYIRCPGLPG